MKISFKQLMELRNILPAIVRQELPVAVSYKIIKIATRTDEENKFYLDKTKEIQDKYAEKDDDGNFVYTDDTKRFVKINEGEIEKCQAEFEELEQVEIEFPDSYKLTLAEIERLSISAMMLQPLMPFIKE